MTIIQSLFRRRQAIKEAQRRRSAISAIQKNIRSYQLRHNVSILHSKATVIQASWRRFITHLSYQFTIVDIIIVQSVFRRWKALKQYTQERRENLDVRIIRIQSLWRSYSCSMTFVKTILDVLIIQSLIRRWLAVRRCQRIKGLQYRIQGELHHDDKVVADGHGAAIIIQKVWRGKKTQLSFVYDLIKIIISQVRWIVRMLWTILPFFFFHFPRSIPYL